MTPILYARARYAAFLLVATVPIACSSVKEAAVDPPAASRDDAGVPSGEPDAAVEIPAATCADHLKNGGESDVDCGFVCDLRCAVGKACNGHPDCERGICSKGVCQDQTDNNGIKDGTETDEDCGGPDARKCIAPKACKADRDCVSKDCNAGQCAPTHSDGAQNLGETDVDCGGGDAARCPPGRACIVRDDCADGGDCIANICQPPANNDGVRNLGETDIDCGGTATDRCGFGRKCSGNADCQSSLFCDALVATPVCKSPTPGDAQTNGDETDIDCGGTKSPACADGRGCAVAADCVELVCAAGAPTAQGASPAAAVGNKRCAAATASDGVKNGSETDVDCGGAAGNPRCAVGESCTKHSDCASDGCHAAKKVCVARRSCAMTAGGDTCGGPADSEVGGEDCCATIDVQRTTKPKVALGKFKITAGRMRQMIDRLGGNVRGFIEGLNLPANRWNPTWTAWLPANREEVLKRLGPDAYPDEYGYGDISGARGCQVSSNGGRPYWFTVADGIAANEVGLYPHDVLDQKVMTCLMPPVAAAFCIWDGGELADPDDLDYAWNGVASATGTVPDTRKWPWGNTPNPPTTMYGAEAACQQSNCNALIVHKWNYNYPAYRAPDSTSIVPAPGRRPAGAGPFGHMDLAGAGFEYAKRTPAAGTTTLHTVNNGSFETHEPVAYLTFGGATVNRRYWAFSAGRCSYPPGK